MKTTSGAVDLWLVFYAEISDAKLHVAYRQILNPAELAQETRFHFARDRIRYMVTRAAVRTILSRYADVAPGQWVFSTNAYGRPFAVNSAAHEAGLTFNVSHTRDLIIVAVATGGAVGVDVENIVARPAPIAVANRFFAASEAASLSTVLPHLRQYRFFEYWTFKESYIKARGMGLSLPLDKFSFHFPREDRVVIAMDPVLADYAARWRFWQFQPRQEYLVAVCAERIGGQSQHVRVRQIIPAVSDTTFAPTFLRTSE